MQKYEMSNAIETVKKMVAIAPGLAWVRVDAPEGSTIEMICEDGWFKLRERDYTLKYGWWLDSSEMSGKSVNIQADEFADILSALYDRVESDREKGQRMKPLVDVIKIVVLGACAGLGAFMVNWLITNDLKTAWWFGVGAGIFYIAASVALKRNNPTW